MISEVSRPLVICDVDEVTLHFIRHLETFLAERDLRFLSHRYRLAGNIAGADGVALDQPALQPILQAFYDAWVGRQSPVAGAAAALERLSASAEIVFLTNLPGPWNEETRARTLARNAMPYPLVVNAGPKGAAAARLAGDRAAPVVFLDDSPAHLRSVAEAVPGARRIHFVADPRFLALSEDVEGVALKTDDWRRAEAYISSLFAR
jgi:hypothetical protein